MRMVLMIVFVVALAGCAEAEPHESVAAADALAPTTGRLTATGYANDYFGFGIGFTEDWRVVSSEELAVAADKVGDRSGTVHLLRLVGKMSDGTPASVRVWAKPPEPSISSGLAFLEEIHATLPSDARTTEAPHEMRVGDRPVARSTFVLTPPIHQSTVAFIDRDHLVVVSCMAQTRAGYKEADAVVATLAFHAPR